MIDQGQAMDLPRQIATGDPYPLRGLMAFGLNHRMWPDSKGFLAVADKLDFVCVTDLFLTDTARHADIVLPACTSVERSELRCYPQKYVILTQPAIEPLGEARSDTDIIIGLVQKLGLRDPLLNPADSVDGPGRGFLKNGAPDMGAVFEDALDWILEPSGMMVSELKKHPAGMPVPNAAPPAFKRYETKGFPTPSGKMEFTSKVLEKHSDVPGHVALPVYAEPKLSGVSTPEVAEKFPLVLNTGSRLPMFIHSRTFRLPWPRSLRRQATADINPATALRLGIDQGNHIELSTPQGSIEVLANLTELAHPETVHMFHDYPEADVNALLAGDYLDPISGFPGYRASLCAVKNVGQSTPAPTTPNAGGGKEAS
jgi:anaerobic selenocysteine-containing dehydrogenase